TDIHVQVEKAKSCLSLPRGSSSSFPFLPCSVTITGSVTLSDGQRGQYSRYLSMPRDQLTEDCSNRAMIVSATNPSAKSPTLKLCLASELISMTSPLASSGLLFNAGAKA